MLVKLKNGDTFLELETDFSNEEIDTFKKLPDNINVEEDTLELSLDKLIGDNNE